MSDFTFFEKVGCGGGPTARVRRECDASAANAAAVQALIRRLLRNANMKVVQHNEVVIGHMILAVKWPKNTGYGVQLQPIENYNRHGKPANATINQDIYRKRMEEEAKKRQGMTNG